MGEREHRQPQHHAHTGDWDERIGQSLPGPVALAQHARRQQQGRAHQRPQRQPAHQNPEQDAQAIQPGENILHLGVVGEQPPGRVVLQKCHLVVVDQPFGGQALEVHELAAYGPRERRRGHADDTKEQRERVARAGRCLVGQDFLRGRAQAKRHGVVLTRAAPAGVAGRCALHVADIDERCAVDGVVSGAALLQRLLPACFVHAEMHWCNARQQTKHAIGRAQVAAPHAAAAPIHPANGHRCHAGSAQHQQGGLWVLVHADQLAVHRGAHKGHEGPSSPAQPTSNGAAQAMAAGKFGECAFRAKHAAPYAPEQQGADHNAWPPHAPEQELRKQPQVGEDAGVLRRHWHEGRDDQQRQI